MDNTDYALTLFTEAEWNILRENIVSSIEDVDWVKLLSKKKHNT